MMWTPKFGVRHWVTHFRSWRKDLTIGAPVTLVLMIKDEQEEAGGGAKNVAEECNNNSCDANAPEGGGGVKELIQLSTLCSFFFCPKKKENTLVNVSSRDLNIFHVCKK